jgi:hypothetical protein
MTNNEDTLDRPLQVHVALGGFGIGALVCILAIAPPLLAWRSPDPNLMIAAVAFDVILLPVGVALIVMVFLPPGQTRGWVVAGLCSTPILLWILSSIVFIPSLYVWEAFHPLSWSSVLPLLTACQFLAFLYAGVSSYIRCCCPRCAGRRFNIEYRYDPMKRASLPTGLHTCRNCGRRVRFVRGWFCRYRIEPVEFETAMPSPLSGSPLP